MQKNNHAAFYVAAVNVKIEDKLLFLNSCLMELHNFFTVEQEMSLKSNTSVCLYV